jgi:hypothetical protein
MKAFVFSTVTIFFMISLSGAIPPNKFYLALSPGDQCGTLDRSNDEVRSEEVIRSVCENVRILF